MVRRNSLLDGKTKAWMCIAQDNVGKDDVCEKVPVTLTIHVPTGLRGRSVGLVDQTHQLNPRERLVLHQTSYAESESILSHALDTDHTPICSSTGSATRYSAVLSARSSSVVRYCSPRTLEQPQPCMSSLLPMTQSQSPKRKKAQATRDNAEIAFVKRQCQGPRTPMSTLATLS